MCLRGLIFIPICSFSLLLAAAGSVEITNRDKERGQLCRELPSVGSGCGAAVNSNGDGSLCSSAASNPTGNLSCFSEKRLDYQSKAFLLQSGV